MKNRLVLYALLLFPIFASAQKSTPIFNGKDLTGWTKHGTEKWYVQGGELICESGPDKQYGYLSTDKDIKILNSRCNLNRKQMATVAYLSALVLKAQRSVAGRLKLLLQGNILAAFMNLMAGVG